MAVAAMTFFLLPSTTTIDGSGTGRIGGGPGGGGGATVICWAVAALMIAGWWQAMTKRIADSAINNKPLRKEEEDLATAKAKAGGRQSHGTGGRC